MAGKLQRDTILPAESTPVIDIPGGDLLYAAAGFLVWEKGIDLLARVGEDYPQSWLEDFSRAGMDTTGVKILPESLDLRKFLAYDNLGEIIYSNPISLFVNRGLPFPKFLSGYQTPNKLEVYQEGVDKTSPRPGEIPPGDRKFKLAHLCKMDFASATRFVSTFRELGVPYLSVDPSGDWMQIENWAGITLLLNGLSAFLPSRESLTALFRKQTIDLVEMAEIVTSENCSVVAVKCGKEGQLVRDGKSYKSWKIPAYPVNVVDPTGAGAAFCGGFMAGLLQSKDPLQAALMGNISASICLEGSGINHILQVQPGLAQARLTSLKEEVRSL